MMARTGRIRFEQNLATQMVLLEPEASFNTWFAPRGEVCSLGRMFTTSFTPRGEHSLLFRGGEQIILPQGDKVHSWGTPSPLRAKVCP
jgi:hypothetical protein